MGFGGTSFVFAGHIVILTVWALLCFRMVPMAAASQRVEVGYRHLRFFPYTVLMSATVSATEAVYYGTARLYLITDRANLWDYVEVVGILRLTVAFAFYWHMRSYFEWRGLTQRQATFRILFEITGLTALWLATVRYFW